MPKCWNALESTFWAHAVNHVWLCTYKNVKSDTKSEERVEWLFLFLIQSQHLESPHWPEPSLPWLLSQFLPGHVNATRGITMSFHSLRLCLYVCVKRMCYPYGEALKYSKRHSCKDGSNPVIQGLAYFFLTCLYVTLSWISFSLFQLCFQSHAQEWARNWTSHWPRDLQHRIRQDSPTEVTLTEVFPPLEQNTTAYTLMPQYSLYWCCSCFFGIISN